MNWANFYLVCFLVGFTLSVLSFLAGAVHLHVHLPGRIHLPFHAIAARPVAGHAGPQGHAGGRSSSHISWFNASTMLAFLAWFGGTGYILTKNSRLVAGASLLCAVFAGLVAGWLVFKFMAKVMRMTDSQLNELDFRLEGSVGTLSMPIRENGMGELIFEQNGSRKSISARSDSGSPLPIGAEVVISRCENGVAYVRRWEDFIQ